MEKGVCIISIDYEYAWGLVDHDLAEDDLTRIRKETEITERLVALFEKYDIPATWVIVGKLLEERADRDAAWTDARGLIRRIKDSSAGHEIGSHSYAHIMYDRAAEGEAKLDIASAKLLHERHDLPFRSFVFPRNRGGHHALLNEQGIIAFRGQSRLWYHILPYRLWALGRGIDYFLPTAHTVLPARHASGLVDIADSLLLVSRKGVQKLLPATQAVRKFRWCLRGAVRRKEVFHLWFHPSNFSHDTETQFTLFEEMLAHLAQRRAAGEIDMLTIGQCADRTLRAHGRFEEVTDEKWRSLTAHRSPFLTKEWEDALTESFPYLRFRHFIYDNAFAVRFAEIGARVTTVPFSDGGDVVALTDSPLSLSTFRGDLLARFGSRVTLRVHEHYCPVTDTENATKDIIDFRIPLQEFDIASVRKTLRHIVTAPLPDDTVIRTIETDADIRAAYRLYLTTMRSARALALPYEMFRRDLSHDAFVFEQNGTILGTSVFLANTTTADYFLSAADAEGKANNAAHHLLMHALTYFAKKGKEAVFLGGTNVASPLRTFKEGWRGEPFALYTVAAGSRHESARRSPLRSLWRLLPLSLLPKASELAGKYAL